MPTISDSQSCVTVKNPSDRFHGSCSSVQQCGVALEHQYPQGTWDVGRARNLNGTGSLERGNNCLKEPLKEDDTHKPFHTGPRDYKEYARMCDSQSHNYSTVEHCQHHLLV